MSAFEYIHYKTEVLDKAQTIAKLQRFEETDKYRSFYKILPAVVQSTPGEREAITNILNRQCGQLISLLLPPKKPHKATLKKVINDGMKAIANAEVSAVNKDFAIELCWYLSDIAGLDMRKSSVTLAWGYWTIEGGQVNVIEHKHRKTINAKRNKPL